MMEEQENKKDQNKIPDKGLQSFAKYSGIAFQMAGIILLATFGGIKLDKLTGWETPVFTIVLSLLGVFAAIWITIRDLIKK
ncbi:MAG TPA: AtpZ/AtpI family protein [Bacteroidales bacterium]|nr:AtpZ/AtpI family protein [Bacteroidales bacterium]HPR13201.1 AtpZ/AtpI family protein [Bacteroidales bacterium]